MTKSQLTIHREVRRLKERLEHIQEADCQHVFIHQSSNGLRETEIQNTFEEQLNLRAICEVCEKEILFSSWEMCPVCFDNISNKTAGIERNVEKYQHPSRIHGHRVLIKTCTNGHSVIRQEIDQ